MNKDPNTKYDEGWILFLFRLCGWILGREIIPPLPSSTARDTCRPPFFSTGGSPPSLTTPSIWFFHRLKISPLQPRAERQPVAQAV